MKIENLESNKKDPKNRSKKRCCCGSHSANDRTKCKNHNSTKSKLNIRKSRKAKKIIYYRIINGELSFPYYSPQRV